MLWTAFGLGLFGGLHCAGMCGPLLLALPQSRMPEPRFVVQKLIYHAGRILTYTLLGVVFGLIGKTLFLAGLQRWVSIGLGLILVTGVLFSPRFLQAPWVFKALGLLKSGMGSLLRSPGPVSQLFLGALNGLLPCGLVYVAAAGSLATGGILAGAGYMILFGAGTLPALLAVSFAGRLFAPSLRARLRRLAPAAVAILGGLLIARGLSLGIPYLSPDLQASAATPHCHVVKPPEARH